MRNMVRLKTICKSVSFLGKNTNNRAPSCNSHAVHKIAVDVHFAIIHGVDISLYFLYMKRFSTFLAIKKYKIKDTNRALTYPTKDFRTIIPIICPVEKTLII